MEWDVHTFEQLYDGYYLSLCLFANKYLGERQLNTNLTQNDGWD
ncbi:MAG: hypothetical protein AB7V25_07900 [Mangrovibacterium sp.]